MNESNDLQEILLKSYIKEADEEQLKEIIDLIENNQYDLLLNKVEEYYKNLNINNKEWDSRDSSEVKKLNLEEFLKRINKDKEEMDPQSFELYCILVLISKHLKEKDENKKRMIEEEINYALDKYRSNGSPTRKR